MHKEKKGLQKKHKRKRRACFDESKPGKVGLPYGPWDVAPRGTGSSQSQPQKGLGDFQSSSMNSGCKVNVFHRQLSRGHPLRTARQGAPALKEMRGM